MLSGFYSAASGMIARSIAMNPITANIAYANVPGYKKQEILFHSFDQDLASEVSKINPKAEPDLASGIEIIQEYSNFSQGSLKYTGDNSDIGIEGDGFFVVDTGYGNFYTRNGTIRINDKEELVTAEGYPILNPEGGILSFADVAAFNGQFIIDDKGNVSGFGSNGQTNIGKINLVKFDDPMKLERIGYGLWKNPGENPAGILTSDASLRQNYKEMPNVNPVEGMMDMILNQRLYDSNSNALKAIHSSFANLLRTLGG